MPETSDAAPDAPAVRRPHVDPGELITLLIRFVAANFLIIVAAYCLLQHSYTFGAIIAVVAALTQRAAIILYRRLREEYATALAEMDTPAAPTATETPAHVP